MPTGVVMLIRTTGPIEESLLAKLREDSMVELKRTGDDKYCREPLTPIKGNARSLIPVEDGSSQWYDVGLWGAVYEWGYERGDLPLFVRVAEWFEKRLPACEVWYGNDCTEESIHFFGRRERECLTKYYEEVGHEPYDGSRPRPPKEQFGLN